MNIFNICIVLILIGFIIGGWKNGVVKETASFIGIIVVFFLSYVLKGIVGNILCEICPFFELDGLISLNIIIYQIIAFVLLFFILLSVYSLLLKISNGLQKIVNSTIILIIPSKILGAIISFIQGWVVIFVILVLLLVPLKNVEQYKESTVSNFILFRTPVLSKAVEPFATGIVEVYKFCDGISSDRVNEANLEAIKIMIKYKIVDKDTVQKLVEIHKLDKIDNIESVLNN